MLHRLWIQNSTKAANLSLKLDGQNEIKDIEVVDVNVVDRESDDESYEDYYDDGPEPTWKDFCEDWGIDYID